MLGTTVMAALAVLRAANESALETPLLTRNLFLFQEYNATVRAVTQNRGPYLNSLGTTTLALQLTGRGSAKHVG